MLESLEISDLEEVSEMDLLTRHWTLINLRNAFKQPLALSQRTPRSEGSPIPHVAEKHPFESQIYRGCFETREDVEKEATQVSRQATEK